MCDACWEATAPARKLKQGQAWYEPPTNRGRRRQERREERRASAWGRALAAIQALSDDLPPGWVGRADERLTEFLKQELRRGERIKDFGDLWERQIDLQLWQESLAEQDAARLWSEMMSGKESFVKERDKNGKRVLVRNKNNALIAQDDIWVSDEHWASRIEDSTSGDRNDRLIEQVTRSATQASYIPFGDEPDDEALNRASLNRFFDAVARLSDEDYATLKVYVHQKRAQRDHGNERAFTSKTAAHLLSLAIGKAVSPATYRKRVERMKKELGRDVDVFVKYRLL